MIDRLKNKNFPIGKGVLLDAFCTETSARVTTVRFNAGIDGPVEHIDPDKDVRQS